MESRLKEVIASFEKPSWDESRLKIIQQLVDFLLQKVKSGEAAKLNFICTHNSRRSQFAQIWGAILADYFDLPIDCFSGGVEVTEFNPRAVKALAEDGFLISKNDSLNPLYSIRTAIEAKPYFAFSKCYDDPSNPKDGFAAIMTCDHADENCPFIPGAVIRIPMRYEDPKNSDGTAQEAEKYSERSHQIGAELFFIFKEVKARLS
jgi:protein-tyrosine-phosphatase